MSADAITDSTALVVCNAGRGSDRRYHTSVCRYVRERRDRMAEWDRDTAAAWFAHCEACAGSPAATDGHTVSYGNGRSRLEAYLDGDLDTW